MLLNQAVLVHVLFIAEYCNNNIKRIYDGVRHTTFIKKSSADALNLLQMLANTCHTIRLRY